MNKTKIWKNEVDMLIINQQLEKAQNRSCFYDGEYCGSPEDWCCEIPVYEGKEHDKIMGWVTCPRYVGRKKSQ